MERTQRYTDIEEFCDGFNLGEVKEIRAFVTGDSHETYFVETGLDKYVFKILDSKKVQRKDSDSFNFKITEQVNEMAKKNGVLTVCANKIEDDFLTHFQGQYYIVYPYFQGERIAIKDLTGDHCFKIGQALGKLHGVKFEEELSTKVKDFTYGWQRSENVMSWGKFFDQVAPFKPTFLPLFKKSLGQLEQISKVTFPSYLAYIPREEVISHCDIFPENVLWENGEPYLIDWEKVRRVDTTYDCLATAMRFSLKLILKPENSKATIDYENFYGFLKGYCSMRDINVEDLEMSLSVLVHIRVLYLQYFLKNFMDARDENERKRLEKNIVLYLNLVMAYHGLHKELEKIRKFILENQVKQEFEKHPSYEVVSKIRKWNLLLENKS